MDITAKTIKITHLPTSQVIMEGTFCERVKTDENLWQLDGDTIVLHLEKATDTIWKSAIEGDAEINTKEADVSRKIEEYDEET